MGRKKHWDRIRMPKARRMGDSPMSLRRRLWDSTYQWNDRPCWEYAGAPRVVLGHDVDSRVFSIRTQSMRGIIWTRADQAWAVEQGFFLQRELIRERPVIIGINRFDQSKFSYWEPYKTMREIERRVFLCVPGYEKLYRFIEQQDRYGYTGAWDRSIACYSRELRWYKDYVVERDLENKAKIKATRQQTKRQNKLAGHVKRSHTRIEQARERMAHAREAKFQKQVREVILDKPTIKRW